MGKHRIAVVSAIGAGDWKSCEVIATNLAASYRQAFGKYVEFFACERWSSPSDIQQTAQRIRDYNPHRLVFLDHTPLPDTLLKPLRAMYEKGLPALAFHVYGDFTRNTREWLQLEETLKGTHSVFICASMRHARLISKFLPKTRARVVECPFPVDRRKFFPSSVERKTWRARLGAEDGDLVLTYTGRISLQKNNLRLIQEILEFAARSKRKIQFNIAGTFDDIGAPLFGIRQKKGTSRKEWNGFLQTLSSSQRRMIRFLGTLDATELRGLYNASDAFCSLSLYHDEDFGMSPAEALSCGTPCLLTDWGGFASFDAGAAQGCSFVPVGLTPRGLTMKSTEVQSHLARLSMMETSALARVDRAREFLANFSVDAVAKRLEEIHQEIPPAFFGFAPMMHRLARRLDRPPLFPDGPRKGGLYEKIYDAYFR